MLDMQLFRENSEIVRDSEKKRFKDPKTVDKVIEYDKKWRDVLKEVEKLKHKRNVVSREIAELKKAKKNANKKIKEMKKVNSDIEKNDKKANECLKKRDSYRYKVGNILHKDVNTGNTEVENKFIRAYGKPDVMLKDMEAFRRDTRGKLSFEPAKFKPISHVDLIEKLDIADTLKASKLSGARFYYLKNELVMLNLALIRFAMDEVAKKGFTPMWTPFMLNKEAMTGAAELGDFEEQLYKIQDEDLFLIATAEQTLATYHMNEIFQEKDLPKTYVGFSTNFRKEAGSHGKDTKGIFRVHQFDKVEQFVFCKPENSEKWFHKLICNAEDLYKKLELPYRVVSVCSGEMNDNASIKYDIEAWMPAQGKFREVVSCSNCTDYQPRKLNVKVDRTGGKREVVHTLNSTALATERTIVAILENYQQKDGSIKIPKALVKYTGFKKIG
ncbi:MAG: serine--tRNA ligase [Candidatus Aenigmarchaeota archaeon]|nr:serine--tRNA ligase [Candidatus Aenigmarchaeota archaeon]